MKYFSICLEEEYTGYTLFYVNQKINSLKDFVAFIYKCSLESLVPKVLKDISFLFFVAALPFSTYFNLLPRRVGEREGGRPEWPRLSRGSIQ